MEALNFLKNRSALQYIVITVAVLCSLAAGLSGIFFPSTFAPLWIVAGLVGLSVLVIWIQKPWLALYAAVFMVLFPTGLIDPQLQSLLNRGTTVAALSVWGFDVLIRRSQIRLTLPTIFMIGFVAWAAITLTWAVDLSIATTILQVYILRLLLFLLLIPNLITSISRMNGLMNTMALNGWILALVSLGTIFAQGYTPGTRLQVFDVNANSVGISLLITMIAVLWIALRRSNSRKTLNLILAFIFIVLTIVLSAVSGSRGSAISLLIILAVFMLWGPSRKWGLAGMLILLIIIVAFPVLLTTIIERFAVVQGDTFFGGREDLWRAGWLLIQEHPWLGVGIGNARYAVMPILGIIKTIGQEDGVSLHNPILTVWNETGLPGVLLYLGVFTSAVGLFLKQFIKSFQGKDNYLHPYFIMTACVFSGYLISWIKGGGTESDFSYFLMLALLLIPTVIQDKEPGLTM